MKRFIICLSGAVTLALTVHGIAQEGSDQSPLASNFLYNYYTQPGASQVTAGMYPAPYWAPPYVGHTYYTYQPLMPHEHMYEHRRTYYQYYGGPGAFYADNCPGGAHPGGYGLNKTTVVWQNGGSHVGPNPLHWASAQGLGYRIASRHYCLGNGGGCAGGQCSGGTGCATGNCQ